MFNIQSKYDNSMEISTDLDDLEKHYVTVICYNLIYSGAILINL